MEQSKLPVDRASANNEEISLKEVILKVQEWWRYLLSKWLVITIVVLIGGVLGLIYALTSKPKYIGELTFVLEEGRSGGSLGAYAGIASQFGFDLGGSNGIGVFSENNIMAFLESRLIIQKALLFAVNTEGKTVTLADLYIDVYGYRKKWEEDNPLLKDVHFPVGQPRDSFSLLQDSILNKLHKQILESNLEISKPDKKSSFIQVTTTSKNELFSKVFTETLVKEATTFYVETKIKRSKVNVDKLQSTADSLESLLNRKTYSVAQLQQMNINPARQVATVGTEVQTRDKVVLQTIYGEVIKNLELSKMSMAQETPAVQIVDSPILPLKKEKVGKLKGLVLGGFFSGFLIVVYLIFVKAYRDIVT